MSGTLAASKEAHARYERIRKEIAAYDDLARLSFERDAQALADRRSGHELLARFRLRRTVEGFPNPPSK